MSGASHKSPVKVAVIGGGCAAMTTAFELSRPEHAGAYQVTVYQQGFRLGGKGASGRGASDRIEEHGLHLWMGFYENAFGLMRECYAELARDPARCRVATFRDAFVPAPVNAVADFTVNGACVPWRVLFPPQPGLPGEPPESREDWTVARYLSRCLSLLATMLESLDGADIAVSGEADLTERIRRLLSYGGLLTLGAVREGLLVLESVMRVLPGVPEELVARLGRELTAAVHARIEALADRDDALRRLWEIVDLVLAVVRGAIRSRLLTDPRGFDAIDDYDCREWLMLNGASRRAIDSAFVRALYDLAFAYEDGDVNRPRIAAGQALRGAVRAFFTYRGSFFWKMTSGMGDIVFAPLYQLLQRRGVRFEFFHRLENIVLGERASADEPSHVAALELDVQAHVRGGGEYQPLCDVRGLPCWPSQPDYAQLLGGAELSAAGVRFESHWDKRAVARKRLEVSRDFDVVVLGVSLGAIPHVARELIAREPRWAALVRHCKTVGTQAFQLWLRQDARELGWPLPPGAISGYVEPFDTWADMSHLISEESFSERVASVAYFCSVLPDRPAGPVSAPAEPFAYPDLRREEVRANAVRFLNADVAGLWPNAVCGRGEFRWELLVPPTAATAQGSELFATQFWTANVNPTDRYALSLPGTLRHRLSPLDASVDNLSVVGDWTDCGFNEGCVEAAVMSGRLGAHAIAKKPALADIIGYDHP